MHPHPGRPLYLGMRDGDLAGRRYAKFWNPAVAPLSPAAWGAILDGPVAAALLLRLADAPGLLDPGDHLLENGYGLQEDGSLHVALRTEMPEVSPAMVDWWFGWHSSEAQRYKLWHPRAHVHAEWGDPGTPGARGRERYLGRVSYVDEYLGSQLCQLAIRFISPAELGFDEAALRDPERATVIAARTGFSDHPLDVGYLVHHVRRVPGGSEMRSRFWIGGPYAGMRGGGLLGERVGRIVGEIVVGIARRLQRPTASHGHDLVVHCAHEMAHLASFLPRLYHELHDE